VLQTQDRHYNQYWSQPITDSLDNVATGLGFATHPRRDDNGKSVPATD